MDKKDRRIFERFEVNFPAELRHSGFKQEAQADCFDVSASGVGVITQERPIPTARLEVLMQIPDGHTPLRSGVRLIWTKKIQEDKWRCGLEFKGVSLMALRRVLERQIKKD